MERLNVLALKDGKYCNYLISIEEIRSMPIHGHEAEVLVIFHAYITYPAIYGVCQDSSEVLESAALPQIFYVVAECISLTIR